MSISDTVTFVPGTGVLKRAVHTDGDVRAFTESATCQTIKDTVDEIAAAVRGIPLDAENVPRSDAAGRIVEALGRLSALADDVVPIEQPMRFGNKAFRTWHARLSHEVHRVVDFIVDGEDEEDGREDEPKSPIDVSLAVASGLPDPREELENELGVEHRRELAEYLNDSFGNATRLDYGTGHETCFLFFLVALRKAGVLEDGDLAFVGTRVFSAYIELCRKVQRRYMLEPAGSHGVWSLDDYQLLVFLFGAAQLVGMEGEANPAMAQKAEDRESKGGKWMFFSAVSFVHTVKTGAPFSEHSPLLFELTEQGHWDRIVRNLREMFIREVLSKRPVVQHFLFGSLLPATWPPSPETPHDASARHVVPGVGSSGTRAPWAHPVDPADASHPMDVSAPWRDDAPSHEVGAGVAIGANEPAPWAPEAHQHHHHHRRRSSSSSSMEKAAELAQKTRPRLPTPAEPPSVERPKRPPSMEALPE